jgi:hypothetical protein
MTPEPLDTEIAESPEGEALETLIQVEPFIEIVTTHGSRSWIRKSSITGVDEVRASSWDEQNTRTAKPSTLVHVLGGKTWQVAAEAEEFMRELGQAQL